MLFECNSTLNYILDGAYSNKIFFYLDRNDFFGGNIFITTKTLPVETVEFYFDSNKISEYQNEEVYFGTNSVVTKFKVPSVSFSFVNRLALKFNSVVFEDEFIDFVFNYSCIEKRNPLFQKDEAKTSC